MELLSGLGGGVALRRAVEIEVAGVDSSIGTEAPFTFGWGLAFAEVLVAVAPLFLTGHCCFDVEPLAFGVAFALEVDAREDES